MLVFVYCFNNETYNLHIPWSIHFTVVTGLRQENNIIVLHKSTVKRLATKPTTQRIRGEKYLHIQLIEFKVETYAVM
jgi:hypothetical protein